MATQCMLTTKDNPYDPFNQFDSWFIYDVTNGYNTCGYLARIAHTSDALTEPENNAEIERAIDEIVRLDPLDLYVKVEKSRTDSST